MKKYGKMSSIFEFSISRLGYVAIFIKISEKEIYPFFKAFLANQGKNENENKKRKMSSIFEFSISKLGCIELFLKVCWKYFDPFFKTFLTNQGKSENEDEKI